MIYANYPEEEIDLRVDETSRQIEFRTRVQVFEQGKPTGTGKAFPWRKTSLVGLVKENISRKELGLTWGAINFLVDPDDETCVHVYRNEHYMGSLRRELVLEDNQRERQTIGKDIREKQDSYVPPSAAQVLEQY
jgi:hypothetical protein